ncbi:MATE family efflux transporter [Lyngbya sp. CCY1209]|uniref:MATE family efflux transporter n=1 Tax=Lyngbya sp. CCY1209 TaxID=2886103 RepID=UPI002D2078D0|nr:MATE family efflux transporter [Lyngbya sp. CCY1209]MEB3884399.1 MATE family efflux transporter [Lyngbya sp. CCY1209]
MNRTLTQSPVTPTLVRLTLPMIWGVFAIIAFSLADTYFVAQLGTRQLAAMSFTFPVVTLLGSVSMGLGVGAASVIARAIGVGERDRVRRLTTNSLSLALLLVALLAIAGLATIDPVFTALGAGPDVLPLVREYMTIWYGGVLFLVVPMVGTSALRAAGDTFIPSVIMTVAALVNIVLDPLLIFGFGPVPGLGLKGAAIATVIGRATTLIASVLFLHFREKMLLWKLPHPKDLVADWRLVLHVGIPATGTQAIAPISTALITGLIATYGAPAVAGFGIATRVEAFALIVLMALSASIGPFVGQNWGAQRYDRVYRAIRISFIFCLIWGLLLTVILAAGSEQIAAQFDTNSQVVAIASTYLTLVPISYGTLGLMLVASSSFNALGKPLPSLTMTVGRLLVLYVPLAYLGSFLFGITGIFAAACFANLVVGIGAYWWTQKTQKARSAEPVIESGVGIRESGVGKI